MVEIPRWRLTSGANVPYVCGCTLRQHKLQDIFRDDIDGCIGFDMYQVFISIISMNPSKLLGDIHLSEELELNLNMLMLISAMPDIRNLLIDALNFFIIEDVTYNEQTSCIDVMHDGKIVGIINADSYDDIRKGILAINHIILESDSTPKFKNKKAKEIYEKIQKGREKLRKEKYDKTLELPNVIEAVSAFSQSYNFTNIFELTVWQLQNQFARVFDSIQMGIYGTRWAAYGEEEFDFSVWHRDVEDVKHNDINAPLE